MRARGVYLVHNNPQTALNGFHINDIHMSANPYRKAKLGLIVGYLSLLAAVAVAHANPATDYELSLYQATPVLVWIGLAVALVVGVVMIILANRSGRLHDAAALLVGGTTLVVFSLPLLRGYRFYGGGDSLSHVGWAREIATGALDPLNLLYPGMHSATVLFGAVADTSLLEANKYVVLVAFPLAFLLVVPMATQLLAATPRAYGIGLLAAALFAPINNISVHPVAHAASQAILISAFVFYLALAYLIRGRSTNGPPSWIPRASNSNGLGGLLAVASVALLLIHPQQGLNVAMCFLAVTGIQLLAHRRDISPLDRFRPLHVQTVVLIAAFLAWAPRFPRVQGAVTATVVSILSQGSTAGEVVASKSSSLVVVGGSLPGLFLKLFLGSTVLSIFAAAVIIIALTWRLQDRDATALVISLTAALVPVASVFLVVLVASHGDQYFRYQGFIMVPVTILAAAGLALAFQRSRRIRLGRTAPVLVMVLFLVLLPAGAAAADSSPYIYQPTSQVSSAQIDGYASSFEHREPEVAYAGVRGGPRRYVDLHYGTERARETLDFPGYETSVPTGVFAAANYTDYFEGPRYFVVTQATYEKEVMLYDGFRYGADGFRALETTPGVNRVQSNDGFTLYRIEDEEAE